MIAGLRTAGERNGQGSVRPELLPVPAERRRRKRTRIALLLLIVVSLAGAGAVVLRRAPASRGGVSGDGKTLAATSTATVSKQDLVARTEVDGALGYASSRSVSNQLRGTVTALPKEGATIERGQSLYSVDQRPVLLLYGELPAWRPFTTGMADGPDVRQLEENLVALGFADANMVSVDEKFTPATAAAIKRWQQALGVEQSGTLELGQVVFQPDAVRVASLKAERGSAAPPGGPVMTVTSTSRVVQVDLEASRQSLVKANDKVDVRLPGGITTQGTIAAIGTVAQQKGQGDSARLVIPVTITLDDAKATGTVDQAPVKVGIISDSRKGVLVVPVNALLALAEGGYGVRVVDPAGGASSVVAVKLGLFARGNVEISGDGIAEGVKVEVPAA